MSIRYVFFDGTAWPAGDEELQILEWDLRYGSLFGSSAEVEATKARLSAASVVQSYRVLITADKKKQRKVLDRIKEWSQDGKKNGTAK